MSKHVKLEAQTREIHGSRVHTLRRNGITPAVVYSPRFPNKTIQLDANAFKKAYAVASKTHVIDLSIDGKVQPVIIKAVDVHPFKPLVRHVDFYAVDLKSEVTSMVELELIGEAPVKKEQGGILNQVKYEVEVSALPDNMPDSIQVDISSLVDFSSSILVSDLPVSKKYTITEEPDTLVVSVVAQSEEQPEEEEEGVSEVPSDDTKKQ